MTSLEISFRWTPIQGLIDVPYSFPQPVTPYLRNKYGGPAIYRWVAERDQRKSIYIGETENLARRLTHYLNPGPRQPTNKRMRDFLGQELDLGAKVSFEVLEFDPFSINGHAYSMAGLGSKEVRCLLENLLLSQLPSDVAGLNRLHSLEQKVIARAALTLNPRLQPDRARTIASGILKRIGQKNNSEEV